MADFQNRPVHDLLGGPYPGVAGSFSSLSISSQHVPNGSLCSTRIRQIVLHWFVILYKDFFYQGFPLQWFFILIQEFFNSLIAYADLKFSFYVS